VNAETPIPRLAGDFMPTSRDPLSPMMKRAVLALVVFFHVGGGWALTQVEPAKLSIGDIAPMEVRMVPADQPGEPEIESAEPPPPVDLKPPPPDLAAAVEPPPPDLPPPEFPVAKLDIPPPPEMPPPVIPIERKAEPRPNPPAPRPAQKRPAAPAPQGPADAQPQQAAPVAAAPRTVSASQVGYLVQPRAVYPARSRKAGEQGTVVVRVQIDASGRASQALLEKSSGHPALDEAALSAIRAAQFRPYAEGGVPQPVWVLAPIKFELQ
jgi:protein TonB